MITLPRLEDTPSIVTPELVRSARMERTVILIFIGVISAIVISIARPHPGDTLPVLTVELARIARVVLRSAHPSFVNRFLRIVTFALWLAV